MVAETLIFRTESECHSGPAVSDQRALLIQNILWRLENIKNKWWTLFIYFISSCSEHYKSECYLRWDLWKHRWIRVGTAWLCTCDASMWQRRDSDSFMNDSQTNETTPCCEPVSESSLTNEEATQAVKSFIHWRFSTRRLATRHASFAVTEWERLPTLLMASGAVPPLI